MKTRARRHCCVLLCIGLFTTRILFSAQTPGSLDETFQPEIEGAEYYPLSVHLQKDGKILVARSWDGSGVWRLNPDGSLDSTFANPVLIEGDNIHCVEQNDGKILVQGFLRPIGGEYDYFKVIRLNADGSLDPTFQPNATTNRNITGIIPWKAHLLVSGFESHGDTFTGFVLRLNLDGSIDPSFTEYRTNGIVAISLNKDRIYVAAGSPTITRGDW